MGLYLGSFFLGDFDSGRVVWEARNSVSDLL